MSHSCAWGGRRYPPDPTSDESADGGRDDIHELDQEYERPKHITPDDADVDGRTYRANPSPYEAEQSNGQGYLEDRTHQQPDPMAGRDDQRIDRCDYARQFLLNYDPQPEFSFNNTAALHNPCQQGAKCIDQGTHLHCPGQSFYSSNSYEVMPSFCSDSSSGAFDNLRRYSEQRQDVVPPVIPSWDLREYYTLQSHQHESPDIKPDSDWVMDFSFDNDVIPDFDVGVDLDAPPAPGEQVEHKEDDPWSSENQHNEHFRLPAAQLSLFADIDGASETSRASHNSDYISNLLSSNTGSTGDAEDPTWGEASVATIRLTCNLPGSSVDHTRYASNLLGYDGQGQRQSSFMRPANPAAGQQHVLVRSLPDRTALQGSSGQTSSHPNSHLQIPISESSSSRPSSPTSSKTSDVLFCPSCPARFKGIYRKGNYRRHRRLKHLGPPREIVCEGSGCNRTFKRTDARLKHHRRHHPELSQGRQ